MLAFILSTDLLMSMANTSLFLWIISTTFSRYCVDTGGIGWEIQMEVVLCVKFFLLEIKYVRIMIQTTSNFALGIERKIEILFRS